MGWHGQAARAAFNHEIFCTHFPQDVFLVLELTLLLWETAGKFLFPSPSQSIIMSAQGQVLLLSVFFSAKIHNPAELGPYLTALDPTLNFSVALRLFLLGWGCFTVPWFYLSEKWIDINHLFIET